MYDIRGFTDDMASRRVNMAVPERSLMLLKATGKVPHEGGQLTKDDSRYHRIIKTWIGDGATVDMKARRVRGRLSFIHKILWWKKLERPSSFV